MLYSYILQSDQIRGLGGEFMILRIDTYIHCWPVGQPDQRLPAISNDNYKLMEAMLARPVRAAVAAAAFCIRYLN